MAFAGGTLFIASGPSGDHLFVTAFDPKKIHGHGICDQILLVPFCSVHPSGKHDNACVVQPGEHIFVKHESYMDYRNSRIESVDHIKSCVDNGTIKTYTPTDKILLLRIQQGLADSKRVPRHIKDDFLF